MIDTATLTAHRSLPLWTRSMRFRITAAYVGVLALLLVGADLLFYEAVRYTLLAQTDAFLTAEVRRVIYTALGSGDHPHNQQLFSDAVSNHRLPPGQAGVVDRDDSGMVTLPMGFVLFDVAYLRYVSGPTRETVAVSPELKWQRPLLHSLDELLPSTSAPEALPPEGRFDYGGPDEDRTMRVFTVPVLDGKPVHGYVQAAVFWNHNADVLKRLAIMLALGFGGALGVAAFSGWVLVGRTLTPIRRIVTEAEGLDAADLPEALLPDAAETDSEVGQLVTTLNRMTTRLREAFAAQRRFGEAQQQFAADASHELRTPLTILRGEIEVALSRPRAPEAYRATLESALEEIAQMGRIVDGLGLLARLDAGTVAQIGYRDPVDLTALVRVVVEEARVRAEEKQVELRTASRRPARPILVRGSADQLLQLLRNLVDNAIKYTPAGGAVSVTAGLTRGRDAVPGSAVVTVRDSGVGIAAADLPHVFDRFWRADESRSSPGTGLGLAISARIAQAHRGTLTAESRPGVGSTFRLTLPLAESPEPPEPARPEPDAVAALSREPVGATPH